MNKEENVVKITIEYNAGKYDLMNGLRIWEMDTENGKFLSQFGSLISLEGGSMDMNYMATFEARYKLQPEDRVAYKFMFQSI